MPVADATPDVGAVAVPDVVLDAAADAVADAAPDAAVQCCPLGTPSCNGTEMGGTKPANGPGPIEYDSAPVGWTQAVDANGCPYWKNIGQHCPIMPVHCDSDPPVFATFSKQCSADTDCAVVLHQINCCGNKVAWGIHTLVTGVFLETEAACASQYPKCKCAQQMTTAEDDKAAQDDGFAVKCDKGLCKSLAP